MEKIKKYEIAGAIFTIIVGTLLHFVYNWSGQSHFIGFFGAVNESTWEHLKLAFWPTFIFAIFEWFMFGRKQKNFCFASAVKLISMPIFIILLFYGWLLVFPDNFIWDISIFIVSVLLGYWFGYRILKTKKDFKKESLSTALIVLVFIAFSLFSYFPPQYFLFLDPVNRMYGIE